MFFATMTAEGSHASSNNLAVGKGTRSLCDPSVASLEKTSAFNRVVEAILATSKSAGVARRVYDGAPVLDCLKDRPGKRSRCLSMGTPADLRDKYFVSIHIIYDRFNF